MTVRATGKAGCRIREPWVNNKPRLRTPQREAYAELARYAGDHDEKERDVGIVLPVGCGKSGCITIATFAFRAARTPIVAPSVKIAQQPKRWLRPCPTGHENI